MIKNQGITYLADYDISGTLFFQKFVPEILKRLSVYKEKLVLDSRSLP